MNTNEVESTWEIEVELSGCPDLGESIGAASLSYEDSGQVEVSMPDRFGHKTFYTFSKDDFRAFAFVCDRMAGYIETFKNTQAVSE